MHVAACKPQAVDASQLSQSMLHKEQEIFTAQALQSGKPENIVEKMVAGRMQKFIKEITLVNQPFVRNPDETIAELLQKVDGKVMEFVRFEVGEGIEKRVENFADEVAAQAANAQKQ